MAKVYSEELFVGHDVADVTLTAPDDAVLVIKCVTCFSSGVALGVTAQIVRLPSNATVWWHKFEQNIGGVYWIEPEIRIVVPSSEQIQVLCDAVCDMGLYGYRLSLP